MTTKPNLQTSQPLLISGVHVYPAELRLRGPQGQERLEVRAMRVLLYLAQRRGEVVGRAELEAAVWPGKVVTEDAVTNTVGRLRRAFGDDARRPRVIETVPKIGYRLIAEVRYADDSRRSLRLRILWAVPALLLLLAALAIGFLPWPSPDPNVVPTVRPSVAVLPFVNLDANPEQDYFADGFTTDLITDLSKVSGLLVIAPGSVFAYRDSGERVREIASRLGVDYVVQGSVQRSGAMLRVNAQLIDGADETALWAERYDGSVGELFAVQDRLAAALMDALRVRLAPAERQALERSPAASVEAYDWYLRGLEAHGHRSAEQNRIAQGYFDQAIALDPQFARAHAGLALAYSRDAIDGWTATPARSLDLARRMADRAASLDPSLAQVHFVSGQVELFQRRYLDAVEATERAIRIDPNYADAYALRAWIFSYAGRVDRAQASMETALSLNPHPSGSYLEVLGEIRYVQAKYAESADIFREVLEKNPDYMRARLWYAAALAQSGRVEDSRWEAEEFRVANPGFTPQQLAFAFPFKDPRILERLLRGLRGAGLLGEPQASVDAITDPEAAPVSAVDIDRHGEVEHQLAGVAPVGL